jgi:hypothetical protein
MPYFRRYAQLLKEAPGLTNQEIHEREIYLETLAPGIAGRLGLSRELMRGAGLALATFAIVWGIWVACPWFDVFTNPVYDSYRKRPEWLWGGYALAAGLLQLVGLARHYPLTSFAGAVCLNAFYLFGALSFYVADWRTPWFPLFVMFLLWHLLIADTQGRTSPNLLTLGLEAFTHHPRRARQQGRDGHSDRGRVTEEGGDDALNR